MTATRFNLPIPMPVGSLEAYLHHINSLPLLSAEEEQRLAQRLKEHDDLDAARQLVLSHLRFVVHIARGYLGYGLALPDLIQEGNIGLMKAVRRFDPSVGVRLVSYAVHWIRAEIHEYILRNWRIVKVATTKAQRKLFFNLRSAKRRLGWLNRGEVERVAQDLGVAPEEVVEMEQRLAGADVAFDPSPEADDEDAAFSPAAYLPDYNADPARQIEDEDHEQDRSTRLHSALIRLDDRSRTIVERRWLKEDDKATLRELADEYGVSAERIRQLEGNALKKLQRYIGAPA